MTTNKAIIVVANSWDMVAQGLVEQWAPHGACLLTAEHLSVAGWRHHVDAAEASMAMVADRQLTTGDISAVVTRLPCVFEQELAHIVPTERAYVAAEMNAFLLAWLTALPCPMLNRPTPTALWGPAWRHEQWVYTAARLGLPVATVRRHSTVLATPVAGHPAPSAGVPVTIVGQQSCGAVDAVLAQQARRLATAAGVDFLTVRFSGPEPEAHFVSAQLWPDQISAEIVTAMLEYLQGHTSTEECRGKETGTHGFQERAA